MNIFYELLTKILYQLIFYQQLSIAHKMISADLICIGTN